MSRFGATGRGGVNRQALTAADTEARKMLLEWAAQRRFSSSIDPIGNLFIRRDGHDARLSPLLTGSHLDSQPTGGNYDGVYGVLAALEAMETLDDHGVETLRPIELVVWMNEEGSRFPPTTMGSAVAAGKLPLETALSAIDRQGISVRDALSAQRQALPALKERPLREKAFGYLEAHIEQGPILEQKGLQIGIVTGIQGLNLIEIEVCGTEAHAGTTPTGQRRDALVEAMALLHKLRACAQDPTDTIRFTVGRFEVAPGSPNTVPSKVHLTIDLRHPAKDVLNPIANRIMEECESHKGRCSVTSRFLIQSDPVHFDPRVVEALEQAAGAAGLKHMRMVSGATHDAKFMADQMPTGMIFVPCKNGISHNEAECAAPEDLTAGAQVLCATLHQLANAEALDRERIDAHAG